ncbi:MAG: hypothetical protein HC900_09755 [Methylacidiphilales bacterium]|nr:hypothetical protein [Candidatus Methylacidiphilales bacterium]
MDKEEVAQVSALLQAAIVSTRTLAKSLVPMALKDAGIAGGLRELADYAEVMHGLAVELALEDFPLPAEKAIQLYRIAREAVTNACKHSGTKNVRIEMRADEGELTLAVRDFGSGLKEGSHDGLGLKIMEYRAAILGAHLEVFRHPEGGHCGRVSPSRLAEGI